MESSIWENASVIPWKSRSVASILHYVCIHKLINDVERPFSSAVSSFNNDERRNNIGD